MSRSGLALYVFGSSLTSAYWNGAATYYRGLYKGLHALGYRITFAEPDILDRQRHRDLPADPLYARCALYHKRTELEQCLRQARSADLIIKHSGVGADDAWLEQAVLDAAAAAPASARPRVAFWDVDAPATLDALDAGHQPTLRALLPAYDFVFTYGGGPTIVARYRSLGARNCFPIYNALDPDTHFPVPPSPARACDLLFLGHRLPDREARVRRFFFAAARHQPQRRFCLAGEGWRHGTEPSDQPANLEVRGYIPPSDHNLLNSSAGWVLNLNRDSMARTGFSPPTRIFEAAGAAAAVLTDAWPGLDLFFEPGREIVSVRGPDDIAACLDSTSPETARRMGQRMRERALADHTYTRRARRVDTILQRTPAAHDAPAAATLAA